MKLYTENILIQFKQGKIEVNSPEFHINLKIAITDNITQNYVEDIYAEENNAQVHCTDLNAFIRLLICAKLESIYDKCLLHAGIKISHYWVLLQTESLL